MRVHRSKEFLKLVKAEAILIQTPHQNM